jgi:hypothetical protein
VGVCRPVGAVRVRLSRSSVCDQQRRGYGQLATHVSDRFGVKAASSRYAVPGNVATYVVTWAYLLGCIARCWTLLKSLFPLCSFMTPND